MIIPTLHCGWSVRWRGMHEDIYFFVYHKWQILVDVFILYTAIIIGQF